MPRKTPPSSHSTVTTPLALSQLHIRLQYSEDDLTRKCRTIEQQNQILLTQYENLKRELRLAKNTHVGTMVSDSRKAAKKGIDARNDRQPNKYCFSDSGFCQGL